MEHNICIPKFSIIIPVYNTEKYLDEAVQSVLNQTESNYEILLVDDGSTDNSGVICDKWVLYDERIKAFHQENKGQLAAREYGLKKASGEYIIFLDSDDMLDCDALSVIDDAFSTYNADCVIYGYRKLEDGVIISGSADKEKVVLNDVNALYNKILSDSAYNSMCRKAFRRELIYRADNYDFYHLRHGEDLVQSLIILYKCKTVVFLSRVLYIYRIISTSISHNMKISDFTSFFDARSVVYHLLKQYDRINDKTIKYYMHQSMKQFIEIIVLVLDGKNTHKEIVEQLRRMRLLSWFNTLISTDLDYNALKKKERIIIWLFINNHMNALLYLFMCWKIIRHH
ncbi:MAG: glycosyltransferase family 2 protein [Clostridia bacterium]|nr:glycosyltransferase family 2 protein [Clostridia bacterium]